MAVVRTADAAKYPCSVHGYHQPAPVWTHWHHVVPKAWTDALGLPEGRVVSLCPHAHDVVHVVLRLALKDLPYTAGPAIRALIEEALEFYRTHGAEQKGLLALAPVSGIDDPHRP